jgi:hypothetical protein
MVLSALIASLLSVTLRAPAEWTVMVFMNGDNDLEYGLDATMSQLAKFDYSSDVNVIAEVDRCPGGLVTQPDWDTTRRFKLAKNESLVSNAQELNEQDMCDRSTLKTFIQDTVANYPAKKYALIIWGHGDGWRFQNAEPRILTSGQTTALKAEYGAEFRKVMQMKSSISNSKIGIDRLPGGGENSWQTTKGMSSQKLGSNRVQREHFNPAHLQMFRREGSGQTRQLMVDEPKVPDPTVSLPNPFRSCTSDYSAPRDRFYNAEISQAIAEGMGGMKLEIVAFDACYMGMVETAYQLRLVANYLVASQEVESGSGWSYTKFMRALLQNPAMSGRDFATNIVQSYQAVVDDTPNRTLSAVDLSFVQDFANAFDAMAKGMRLDLATNRDAYVTARKDIVTFGFIRSQALGGIDTGRLFERLLAYVPSESIKEKVRIAQAAYQRLIVDKVQDDQALQQTGASGLSIYFPKSAIDFNNGTDQSAYRRGETNYPVAFVDDNDWSQFLLDYHTP